MALKQSYTRASVDGLCNLFGKSRQAFYDKQWFQEERNEAQIIALELVAEIRREIPRIGTKKLYHMIKQPLETHGVKMGRDALHELLLDHGLAVRPKRRYVKTTNSNHYYKRYPNIIKDLVVIEPEQVWVADITYIVVGNDFNYLNLITDLYSKRIMGYCLHLTLEAEGTLLALSIALNNRQNPRSNLIHHSDRGSQYGCGGYIKLLEKNNIGISMTEKKDPYENAVAERVNGILKTDFELSQVFKNRDAALAYVDKSIRAYNELRPHMSCNYLTPQAAHEGSGQLEKRWKNKVYKKHELSNV